MYAKKINTQKDLLKKLEDKSSLSQTILDELSFLMSPSKITEEDLGIISELLLNVPAQNKAVTSEKIRKLIQTTLNDSLALYEETKNTKHTALQQIVNALALLCSIPSDERSDEHSSILYKVNRAYHEMLRDYLNPAPKTEHDLFMPDAALLQNVAEKGWESLGPSLTKEYNKRWELDNNRRYTDALYCSLHMVEILLNLPKEKMTPSLWDQLSQQARNCSYYLYMSYKNDEYIVDEFEKGKKDKDTPYKLVAADMAWEKAREFRASKPASEKTIAFETDNPETISLIEQATKKVEAQIFGSQNDPYLTAKMPYAEQMNGRIFSQKWQKNANNKIQNLYLNYYKEKENQKTTWKLKYGTGYNGVAERYFDRIQKRQVLPPKHPNQLIASVLLAKQTNIGSCVSLSHLFVYEAENLVRDRKRKYDALSDAEKKNQSEPKDFCFTVVSIVQMDHTLVLVNPAQDWDPNDSDSWGCMVVDLWTKGFSYKRYHSSGFQEEMEILADVACDSSYKGTFTTTKTNTRDTSSDGSINEKVDKLEFFPQQLDMDFGAFLSEREAHMKTFSENVVSKIKKKMIQSIDESDTENNKDLPIKVTLKKR